MISKHLPASSFYHTCRYISQKPGVEVLLTEGVRGHNFNVMAEDFIRQQQLRPTKQMACSHLILSFYPGEKPSNEMMKEIAKKYLEKLGIVNTQYAVSKHTDKAHLHMHIVANMVNNDGKVISDSWMGLKGKKIAQKLTLEYKLVEALKKDLTLTHMESLSQSEANKYKIYIAISETLPHCRTMEDLVKRLKLQGIESQYKYKGQTLEKQGVSFKIGNDCFKGSKVDRKFSLGNLEYTLQLQQRQLLEQQNLEQKQRLKLQRHKKITGNQGKTLHHKIETNPAELEIGIAKIIDILLTPVQNNEQIPIELLREEHHHRRRRRPK
jgi:hypothetical protein